MPEMTMTKEIIMETVMLMMQKTMKTIVMMIVR